MRGAVCSYVRVLQCAVSFMYDEAREKIELSNQDMRDNDKARGRDATGVCGQHRRCEGEV